MLSFQLGCYPCVAIWGITSGHTFQSPGGKVAQTADDLIYLDSQASSHQAILHSTVRVVFLYQSDHASPCLKPPDDSRLPSDLGKVWNPKQDSQSFIFLAAFALYSMPTSVRDTWQFSASWNAQLLGASGLCLICFLSLKTLPRPSSPWLGLVAWSESKSVSHSVLSHSSQPHGL